MIVLNPIRRNAGTYTTTYTPDIQPGSRIQVTISLDPADAQDATLAISYFVETLDGRRLIQGEWQGGIKVTPLGPYYSQPVESITWPFPDAVAVRGSITISRRVTFGVDVSVL